MSGIIFEDPFVGGWPSVLAVFCSAAAVKLLDDVIDEPADREFNRPNWTRRLGRATTAYALWLLAVGAALDSRVAASLFCAAYAWGMAGQWDLRMPSGLSAVVEGAVALGIAAFRFGILPVLIALCLIGAADLLDDAWDRTGSLRPQRILLGSGLASFSLALAPIVTLAGLAAAALFIGPLAGPRARQQGLRPGTQQETIP